jgi:hypothetical protein
MARWGAGVSVVARLVVAGIAGVEAGAVDIAAKAVIEALRIAAGVVEADNTVVEVVMVVGIALAMVMAIDIAVVRAGPLEIVVRAVVNAAGAAVVVVIILDIALVEAEAFHIDDAAMTAFHTAVVVAGSVGNAVEAVSVEAVGIPVVSIGSWAAYIAG